MVSQSTAAPAPPESPANHAAISGDTVERALPAKIATAVEPCVPAELRTLYPFSSHWFRTPSGAQMHYLDEYGQGGEGQPPTASAEAVLMLHGNPTWSFYYAQLVQAVSPKLRCIVPDHIGMGFSEKPENYSYRLQTRIDDIAALVAQLGLRRVHLVVHDWGGAIGFGFAARHSELIGRIVILNTAAFPSLRIPARIALCKAPLLGPLIVRGLNGFARPALSMSMARRKLSALEKRALLLPYDSWVSRVAVSGFVRDIPMNASHPSWPALNAAAQGISQFQNHPALILWGGRDFCFNTAFYDEWRKRLPQAEAHYLADAGHYILLDAAEEAVPRITRFLVG